MKTMFSAALLVVGGLVLAGFDQPGRAQQVPLPGPNDQQAYPPLPASKPLPPESLGDNSPPPPLVRQPLPEEDTFVKAYQAARSPRIMVFVNRTIQGEILPKDNLEELIRVEDTQSSNAAVPVNTRHTTSIKTAAAKYDTIGASRTDYEAIELSLLKYLSAPGVDVRDAEVLRAKMDREAELRLENNDRTVVPLLKKEFQTDILVQVAATPTSHAAVGQAVRMLAKAIRTTDGRVLASDYEDLPLPMTKTVINIFTRQIARHLMLEMATVWGNGGSPVFDPIELRIYKAASVDDTLSLRTWVQKVRGVRQVISRGLTGGSATAYAVLAVAYDGPPEDLYADLKANAGASTGLKAVDVQGNTINLEVTGPMALHTVTTTSTTTTTTDVTQPINPAPAATNPPPAPVNPLPTTDTAPTPVPPLPPAPVAPTDPAPTPAPVPPPAPGPTPEPPTPPLPPAPPAPNQ